MCGGWLAHVEATIIIFYRSCILNFSPQTPIIFLTSYHPAHMHCSRTSEGIILGFDMKLQLLNKNSLSAAQNFPPERRPLC